MSCVRSRYHSLDIVVFSIWANEILLDHSTGSIAMIGSSMTHGRPYLRMATQPCSRPLSSKTPKSLSGWRWTTSRWAYQPVEDYIRLDFHFSISVHFNEEEAGFIPLPFLPAFLLSDLFLPLISALTGFHDCGLVTRWAQLLITSSYYLPSTPKDWSTIRAELTD